VEPFEMEPRALARTKALRDSLKRRGWRELPNPESQNPNRYEPQRRRDSEGI